jgi:hypothetical protein
MLSKMLRNGLVLACGALFLASLEATADDKKGDQPAVSGSWRRKDGELTIEFADKGVLKIAPHGDSAVIGIVCDYRAEKEGVIKAKVTGYEGKEEAKQKVQEHLPIGLEFSFKWTVKGDVAKLENLTGDKVPDALKTHLEGDFVKK